MIVRTDKRIWTYLIVTAVTVVIWFLAASETRESERISAALLLHVADTGSPWIVSPARLSVQLTVEGTRPAIERAREVAREGMTIELPPVRGSASIGLLELVRRNAALAATGVAVVSIDRPSEIVRRDEIVSAPARVRASLPGVQTEGEVTIDPVEALVNLPAAMRERVVGEIVVEAFLDRAQLERLAPDVRHETEAKLRVSDAVAAAAPEDAQHISITPSTVKLGFTIKSRTSQVTLDTVRVRLSGPPEDNEEYLVEFEEEMMVIRNVTVTGESDLIRRIREGEVRVFAVLDLDSREKEVFISRKRISYFVALVPEPDGGTRGVVVDGRVGDSATLPEIRLTIERKEAP